MTTSAAAALASQAKKAREATVRRDQLIQQMRAEGASLRTIAEAAGLTHTAIARILKRGEVMNEEIIDLLDRICEDLGTVTEGLKYLGWADKLEAAHALVSEVLSEVSKDAGATA